MRGSLHWWRDDRGQAAGIEVLPFGFLIFVIGALLLANAWAVVDAKLSVSTAAREAARTAVEAPDERTAMVDAETAARLALAGEGRDGDPEVLLSTDGPWGRCNLVTAEVRATVPAISLPFVGGFGADFEVSAQHSEIVDPYRSGLAGEASCD
jgi:hypothetical protein